MHRVDRIVSHLFPSSSSSSSSSPSSLFPLSTSAASPPIYENIVLEKKGRVGLITLNRPKALNALNKALMTEVGAAIRWLHIPSNDIGCIVITGSGNRAFAAGADIKEMLHVTLADQVYTDLISGWESTSSSKIPTIAAVNGFAFGGGCELAMMCDIIIAADNAKFGQPEIKIGTIPGAGGTQRLIRAIGKSRAMEMCLTGEPISAADACQYGLVSRVVPQEKLMSEVLRVAEKIASLSKPVVMLCKESVLSSLETPLSEGMKMERKMFHTTFGLKDRSEGMHAFAEKRPPQWSHR